MQKKKSFKNLKINLLFKKKWMSIFKFSNIQATGLGDFCLFPKKIVFIFLKFLVKKIFGAGLFLD